MAPEPQLTGDLPDVNVWLALTVTEHPHHAAAQAYWHEVSAARVLFNRVTMLGLVRLLMQPKVMGSAAFDAAQAWARYRLWRALPEVGSQEETAAVASRLEQTLAELCTPALPARLFTDAYLAAFAQAAGLRLVTFDRDFRRFANQGAVVLMLGPSESVI